MDIHSFQELFESDRKTRLVSWQFSEELASLLYARVNAHSDFARWPHPAKIYYACYDLVFQVGNGGFAQAAYNVPHLFRLAAEGYELLGLKAHAAHIRKASLALPAEHRAHQAKGLLGLPTIGAVFAHFEKSELSSFDSVTEEKDWWLSDNLDDYARKHEADFLVLDAKDELK